MSKKRIVEPTDYPWDVAYQERAWALGVERNGLLCISGLTAEEYDSKRGTLLVRTGDLSEQLHIVFSKLQCIVEAAGYAMADIVWAVDYFLQASLPSYRTTADIRQQYLGNPVPCASGVMVDGIPNSASLVAITAVAQAGGREKSPILPKGARETGYSAGLKVGTDWFWLSGATGRTADMSDYPDSLEAQAEVVWNQRLASVAHEAGVDLAKVIRASDYIHPSCVAKYNATEPVRRRALKGNRHALATLPIQRLLGGRAVIETEATCYLGSDKEVIDIPEWEATWGKSAAAPAIRCGKYVFCSSLGPIDYRTGKAVGAGDMQLQVEKTYDNVGRVLDAAGCSWNDVVRVVEYVDPQNAYQTPMLDKRRRAQFEDGLPPLISVTANQGTWAGTSFSMEVWAVRP